MPRELASITAAVFVEALAGVFAGRIVFRGALEILQDLLAKTPVNELEVRAHPRVFFRVDEVTWIDAIVRYVVPPREAGAIKTRLIPKLLAALNAEPDKVMFPAGPNR